MSQDCQQFGLLTSLFLLMWGCRPVAYSQPGMTVSLPMSSPSQVLASQTYAVFDMPGDHGIKTFLLTPRPDALSATASPRSLSSTRFYRVKKGDSLAAIARRFYGTAEFWPKIYLANRDILRNPHQLTPGSYLRLP